MARSTFRYRRTTDELVIQGKVVPVEDGGQWFAPLELVGPGSLASLAKAFRDSADNWGLDTAGHDRWGLPSAVGSMQLTEAPTAEFDEDYSIALPMEISLTNEGLVIDMILELHGTGLDEPDILRLLEPLVTRKGGRVLGLALEGAGSQAFVKVRVGLGRRGATVFDACDFVQAAMDLVAHVHDGGLTAESALDLIRAGRADLLIGMPEADWLEAKSRGYDLRDDGGRIELAQDVARFANGSTAGLLIIGLTTKRRAGQDVISSLLPASEAFDASRYHRALDNRVFPPLEGLIVENVTIGARMGMAGHLLAILVPAQPEEAKPVLVHGALVRGRVEGAFISIVQRRGEHSVAIRPEAIHATLAAGRALLRRGKLP